MFVFIYLMIQFFRCPLSHPKFADVSGILPDVVVCLVQKCPDSGIQRIEKEITGTN